MPLYVPKLLTFVGQPFAIGISDVRLLTCEARYPNSNRSFSSTVSCPFRISPTSFQRILDIGTPSPPVQAIGMGSESTTSLILAGHR
jgi:hypothetical protein